jgi:hypothetical protein
VIVDQSEPIDLHAHRAALLGAQGIAAEDLPKTVARGSVVRDFVLAVLYSAYALPISWFVVQEGARVKHLGLAAAVVAFAALFFVLMWRSFTKSYRAMKRAKSYEGVLIGVDGDLLPVAEFEGGTVHIPAELKTRLVPGVRYRVHAPDTEDVAIDVAVDEVDVHESAYR